MVTLGADAEAVTVLRNGVDLRQFSPPEDREAARKTLGLQGPTLVSVGHLIERKRHHLVIEALVHLPDWSLVIAGEGPERGRLESLAYRLGVANRVRLLGARPHAALGEIYGAADVLVLASSREGWANVLLEAMACGTPVVASDIPGNSEVVQRREAGLIAGRNTAEGLAEAVRALWAEAPARDAVRAYAEAFSWEATSTGQIEVFARARARFAARQRGTRADTAIPVNG